jgi:hypothetical protein
VYHRRTMKTHFVKDVFGFLLRRQRERTVRHRGYARPDMADLGGEREADVVREERKRRDCSRAAQGSVAAG